MLRNDHSQMNGDLEGASGGASWTEFCEQRAASASEDFSRAVRVFFQEHPAQNRPNALHDFASKYVEYFLEHFEAQTLLRHLSHGSVGVLGGGVTGVVSRGTSPHNSPHKSPRKSAPPGGVMDLGGHGAIASGGSSGAGPRSNRPPGLSSATRSHTFDVGDGAASTGTGSATGSTQGLGLSLSHEHMDHGDYHEQHQITSPSPTKHSSKSFFRRFSIRGIRNNIRPLRQLFKQHSDEIELPNNSSFNDASNSNSKKHKNRHEKGDKAKMTKMLVECKKEGIVNQLVDEDFCGKTKWDKCRLVLVKTTGGYILEFFIPPKVQNTSKHA